jgi:hypothetical protein
MFQQMGIAAILSLLMGLVPGAMGIVYAARPTEARLALMRPLSLAGLFGALAGFTAGLINALQWASSRGEALTASAFVAGIAESMVPLFVAFGSLTVAWLLVALGLRRQAAS